MKYFCYICLKKYESISIVISHLKIDHFIHENKYAQLKCICNRNCVNTFKTFNGLRKHSSKCGFINSSNNMPCNESSAIQLALDSSTPSTSQANPVINNSLDMINVNELNDNFEHSNEIMIHELNNDEYISNNLQDNSIISNNSLPLSTDSNTLDHESVNQNTSSISINATIGNFSDDLVALGVPISNANLIIKKTATLWKELIDQLQIKISGISINNNTVCANTISSFSSNVLHVFRNNATSYKRRIKLCDDLFL